MLSVFRFCVAGVMSIWFLAGCNGDDTGTSGADGTVDVTEVGDSSSNLEVVDDPGVTEDPEPDEGLDQAVVDITDEGEDVPDVPEIEDIADEEMPPFVFDGVCPADDTGGAIGFGPIDTTAGTIEIHLRHCEPVAGFQFDLIGTEISAASGGRAEEAFGTVTTNNPGDIEGGRVVAIDLGGATMSPTVGDDTLLVVLDYTPVLGHDQVCFQQVVISSPGLEPHRLEMNIGECASPI